MTKKLFWFASWESLVRVELQGKVAFGGQEIGVPLPAAKQERQSLKNSSICFQDNGAAGRTFLLILAEMGATLSESTEETRGREGGPRCVHIKYCHTRWGLRQGERGVRGGEREERHKQRLRIKGRRHDFLQPLLVTLLCYPVLTWEASSAVQRDASKEKELHIWSLWRVS